MYKTILTLGIYGLAAGLSLQAQPSANRRAEYLRTHPPQSSIGLIPLTDMGTSKYKGEEGGLYPGGGNEAPAAHLSAGLKIAKQITPLWSDGKPNPLGRIVILSIGFSNPSIEFPAFERAVALEPRLNPLLQVVNGCVGGQSAASIANPESEYWRTVGQRLAAAGATAAQVQVLWLKLVNPTPSGAFPADAERLHQHYVATLHIIHDRFPNARLAYLSSRTYGGYTEAGGSPEPFAYETGFAVKRTVADQLVGKPELNFDAARGPVRSPWIAWGPYLWTDGVKGRKDGFIYLREDLREDGLHPSELGREKIASLLLNFFKSHETTRPWFLLR